jgi:hypothetical protein
VVSVLLISKQSGYDVAGWTTTIKNTRAFVCVCVCVCVWNV